MLDEICKIKNGWCARHKHIHTGRILELSQMDNEKGATYRKMWDEIPELLPRLKIECDCPDPALCAKLGKHIKNKAHVEQYKNMLKRREALNRPSGCGCNG